MTELEQEWQTILSKPVRLASTTHHELRQMAQQRIKQLATRIANIEKAYSRLKTIRQRAEELRDWRATSASLLDYYDALLNKYEVQLAKARFIHQVAMDRFGRAR